MPTLNGSFSATITSQSLNQLTDQPDHLLGLAEVNGVQKSSDPLWDGSRITYWGVTDLVGAQGKQSGYYINNHGEDGNEWGTFEGKVSVAGGQMTVEGTWKVTGGSGKFRGMNSSGTFKTRATSPTTIECSYEGAYELAKAQAG